MPSPEERRRYNRLVVPLSVEFHTRLPETGEVQLGNGVLRDISLSGSYFHVPPPASFKPGQIISLTIAAPLPFLDFQETSHLKAKGEVVRCELPSPANPYYGVAVHFLEGPSFASLRSPQVYITLPPLFHLMNGTGACPESQFNIS